jgi:hypothetical protein
MPSSADKSNDSNANRASPVRGSRRLKRAIAQVATPGWSKDERAEALVAAKGKRLVA